MKRLFLLIFSLALLTACGKEAAPPPASPPVEAAEEVLPAPVEEIPPADVPITDQPSGEVEQASYISAKIEGLVEDTVGYVLEVPTFENVPEAVNTFYADLGEHLERYTRETVYAEAAARSCVVSVESMVTSATVKDGVLAVGYTYHCDFSDRDVVNGNSRTDRFDLATGEHIS